ncbi:DUF1542 domain-containing protein, partial [Apilactobacillus sp. TMW 2.2459]|uniref:DUF1542 domain-containing protein n=1 Tax=Apilactobacillus xinyiensis TaxID=2841032 RepID=UPI00200C46B2
SNLDNTANAAKQTIDNSATLTSDEKKAQKDKVDQANETAKQAVKDAKDADAINNANGDGNKAINNVPTVGQSIKSRIADANKELSAAKDKAINDINSDDTLTEKQKSDQVNSVNNANTDAQNKVSQSNTADDINTNKNNGLANISKIHQSSNKTVTDQKNDARANLGNIVEKTKNDINSDETLTTDDKAKQVKAVDDANTVALNNIKNAQNADDINKAVSDGQTNISGQHQPGTSVKDRRKAANEQLQQTAEAAQQTINNNVTLTTDEKNTQTNQLTQAIKDAQDKVNGAQNADDINAAQTSGESSINAVPKNSTSLEDRRTAAN